MKISIFTGMLFRANYLALVPGLLLNYMTVSAQKSSYVEQFNKLISCFGEHEFSDTLIAKSCLDSAINIATVNNDVTLLAEANKNLGWFHQDHMRLDKALISFNAAKNYYEQSLNLQGIADMYGNIGNVYQDFGDYIKAIQSHHYAYKINESILVNEKSQSKIQKAKLGKAYALGNLGNIYFKMNEYQLALKYQLEGLEIETELDNNESLTSSYTNLGITYKYLKDYDKALEYHQKALKIHESEMDSYRMANDYTNLSTVYKHMGNMDKAMELILKSIEHGLSSKNRMNLTYSYNNYAELLRKKGEFQKALTYALESLKLSNELNSKDRLIHTNYLLYEIYNDLQDYKNALYHHTNYMKYQDSLFSEKKSDEMYRKSILFDLEKDVFADSLKRVKDDELRTLKHNQEIQDQRFYTYVGGGGFLLMLVIAFQLLRGNRRKQKSNKMLAEKNEIISKQQVETEKQRILLQEKQKEIVDSINYAKRIQYALLAQNELLEENMNDFFVLYEPKDIVSGDFYWASKKGNRFYLAVCDCTGHGVPGAFMSLLNISFLNEAVNERNIVQPNEVLNYVRERLILNMSIDSRDGMDAILICIDKSEGKTIVTYSAANNSPCLLSSGSITELPADKMPVGKNVRMDSFSLNEINFNQGDILYLRTDGYADQFGGPKGKKFRSKNLLQLIESVSSSAMINQKEILHSEFHKWRGSLEQIDDVCIIGLKL